MSKTLELPEGYIPKLGDRKLGTDIGLLTKQWFIYSTCVTCGQPRFRRVKKGDQPLSLKCLSCGQKAKRVKRTPLPLGYPPVIGEVRYGDEIGLRSQSMSYIWQACLNCGHYRWVNISKRNRYCKVCRNTSEVYKGVNNKLWKGGSYK